METVTLALNAMNTRFELVLHGENPVLLRAAGEEALREVERIEGLLSAFRSTSEISEVNARASAQAVQVSPEVFEVLLHARALWELTEGAFDITVGPLMRCWGFWGKTGHMPDPAAVEAALDGVGMGHLELDSQRRTVRFRREKMTLDLGAIGKGYAIGQAVDMLEEGGVRSGLLHGGTSTTYGIGRPVDQSGWLTEIACPPGVETTLPLVEIRDEALSASASSEKSFTVDGVSDGHVIDPRSGWPVEMAVLSVVTLKNAAEADALSTALLVSGVTGLKRLQEARSGVRGLVVDLRGNMTAVGMKPSPNESK